MLAKELWDGKQWVKDQCMLVSFIARLYDYTFTSDYKDKYEGGVRKKDKEVGFTTFNIKQPI